VALEFETANAAVYQMIHRAASACAAPGETCSLAYLHFHAEQFARGAASGDQYRSDLAYLHELMGRPSAFNFYVVEVSLEATAAFGQIEGLKKGTRETDQAVRRALLSNRLFDFGESTFEQIT
jgi:hypothetical protein